jgi:DMSO/TMAO reductase YedYZ molybdopterin-dependent catalytic subunit
MAGKKIGLHELYRQDPIEADRQLWGRESGPLSRRGFLRGAGYAAMTAALGATIPYGRFMPAGLIPVALADASEPLEIPGKDGLIVLGDKPLNAETPAWLLDDDITPASRLFVRNNGIPPQASSDPGSWTLQIAGESCLRPQTFSLAQLQKQFTHHSYQLVLECGGNGRSEFNPPASGNQWTVGAVGCPMWTGVRLRDVLEACGIADTAVYIGYYGTDTHLSGNPDKNPISRGVPMSKALEDETLLVWAMNGEPLPLLHGYPLRLVCGGWPASTSGKWLNRIVIRDRVHDGEKMGETSYRVPCTPIAPGASTPDSNMCIIESMPVRSLLTHPRSGSTHELAKPLAIRGHAWAGDKQVAELFLSMDFGVTWQQAELHAPVNRLAWQNWNAELQFPGKGYFEVWARAVDEDGNSQPMVLPGWNPKGYLNNACHRIAVQVV